MVTTSVDESEWLQKEWRFGEQTKTTFYHHNILIHLSNSKLPRCSDTDAVKKNSMSQRRLYHEGAISISKAFLFLNEFSW